MVSSRVRTAGTWGRRCNHAIPGSGWHRSHPFRRPKRVAHRFRSATGHRREHKPVRALLVRSTPSDALSADCVSAPVSIYVYRAVAPEALRSCSCPRPTAVDRDDQSFLPDTMVLCVAAWAALLQSERSLPVRRGTPIGWLSALGMSVLSHFLIVPAAR
jgi:hypothetical protein